MRRAIVLFIAGLLASCGQSLDSPTVVKDLRVLSVVADPPEVLFPADILTTPPAVQTINIRALTLDPIDEPVTYRWSLCPVESANGCDDYEALRNQAPPEFQDLLDAMHSTLGEGTAPPLDTIGRAVPPRDVLEVTVPITPVLVAYFLRPANALDLFTGAWPSIILDLTSPTQTLRVAKRLVLNIEDPGNLAYLINVTPCPLDQTPSDVPGCLPIRDRTPNHNPQITRVRIARGKSPLAPFEDLTQLPLEVVPDENMRILPILSDVDYESYQELRGSLQNGQLEVEDKVEQLSISWYCSAGKLQDSVTWPKFTKTLDTTYTAPAAAPAETNGLVTVWMVARDQRGGEDWYALDIEVIAP